MSKDTTSTEKSSCETCEYWHNVIGAPELGDYYPCQFLTEMGAVKAVGHMNFNGHVLVNKTSVPDIFPECNGYKKREAE